MLFNRAGFQTCLLKLFQYTFEDSFFFFWKCTKCAGGICSTVFLESHCCGFHLLVAPSLIHLQLSIWEELLESKTWKKEDTQESLKYTTRRLDVLMGWKADFTDWNLCSGPAGLHCSKLLDSKLENIAGENIVCFQTNGDLVQCSSWRREECGAFRTFDTRRKRTFVFHSCFFLRDSWCRPSGPRNRSAVECLLV